MPLRYTLNRVKRFFIYRVLHVDDTPHRIALGVAIGIFVAWTPTITLQMVLTVALATLLRANKAVGVPFVWISNPLTLGPVYGPNYLLGCWILGGKYKTEYLVGYLSAAARGNWFEWGWWQSLWRATWVVFWPLWTGSIVVGLLLAVLAYILTKYAVARYRRYWHRRHPAPPEPAEKAEPDATPGLGR